MKKLDRRKSRDQKLWVREDGFWNNTIKNNAYRQLSRKRIYEEEQHQSQSAWMDQLTRILLLLRGREGKGIENYKIGGKRRESWFTMGKTRIFSTSARIVWPKGNSKTEKEWADFTGQSEKKWRYNCIHLCKQTSFFCVLFLRNFSIFRFKTDVGGISETRNGSTESTGWKVTEIENLKTRIVIGVLLDKDGIEVQVWLQEFGRMDVG